MLFFSLLLLTDVGFQLSFLSTLGILLLKPLWQLGENFVLADDVGTTLAAQIAALQVLFTVFGQYGLLSVLVNALVLWTVPILMILGSLALILGIMFEPLGKILLFLCYQFLLFFEKVVGFFGSIGWTLQVAAFPLALSLGYYLLLLAVVLFFRKKEKVRET